MKYTFFSFILLFSAYFVSAQSVVKSEDSVVEVQSFLSNDILLNESIADTLIIKVKGKKDLMILQMATDVFLKKYGQNAGILNKMKFEGEPYCNVVPNCDKILRLPFIKAIQPMGQGKYALVGYLKAKSPVTIIRHIWILDTSGAEPKIEKRIAFFGNAEYIAFCYNLLENELFVFQNMPRGTPIKENGIFIIKDDWTLSDAGISIKPLTKEDFNMFHQKSIMQNNQDIGIGIYKIPSGEPYGRMPSVNDTVSIYKILLK